MNEIIIQTFLDIDFFYNNIKIYLTSIFLTIYCVNIHEKIKPEMICIYLIFFSFIIPNST